MYNTSYDREPKLEDFEVRYVPKPDMLPISSIVVDPGLWGDSKKRLRASFAVGAVIWALLSLIAVVQGSVRSFQSAIETFLGLGLIIAGFSCVIIWPVMTAIGKAKISQLKAESQASQYNAALRKYENDKIKAEEQRKQAFIDAHRKWEEQQEQIRRETEAKLLEEQRKRELKEQMQREENEADVRMAQSRLVPEIARHIVKPFKSAIDTADRETHMKIRVRFVIEVQKGSIDYYTVSAKKNVSHFTFSEEGISERLSPILRKSLCKALSTELRKLILEAYPMDPNGQNVQVRLENEVELVSDADNVPGKDSTVPEYDDNSYATATLLYESFEQKPGKYF